MAAMPAASSPSPDSTAAASDAASSPRDLAMSVVPCTEARPSQTRERRRITERRSRMKRKEQLASMPLQVARLERTALVLRLLSDPDAAWDEFLDDETKRMRDNVRRLVEAHREAKKLAEERSQLRYLLREQQVVVTSITTLMRRQDAIDDWGMSERRWRMQTARFFSPLTHKQCIYHMRRALHEVNQFTNSYGRTSTGLSFLGWRDSRRLLRQESALQFSFEKTYRGYDVDGHIDLVWRAFTDQSLYCRLVLGDRGRVSVQILQEVSPTAIVVRISESYDGFPVTFHELFLIFRVETESSVVQYFTCLQDTDLQQAINASSDVWISNFYCIRWDFLDPAQPRSCADYKASIGGCLRGNDPEFLHRWMFELLAAVVRVESLTNSRSMLQF